MKQTDVTAAAERASALLAQIQGARVQAASIGVDPSTVGGEAYAVAGDVLELCAAIQHYGFAARQAMRINEHVAAIQAILNEKPSGDVELPERPKAEPPKRRGRKPKSETQAVTQDAAPPAFE